MHQHLCFEHIPPIFRTANSRVTAVIGSVYLQVILIIYEKSGVVLTSYETQLFIDNCMLPQDKNISLDNRNS